MEPKRIFQNGRSIEVINNWQSPLWQDLAKSCNRLDRFYEFGIPDLTAWTRLLSGTAIQPTRISNRIVNEYRDSKKIGK
jgi:hypothetical protein